MLDANYFHTLNYSPAADCLKDKVILVTGAGAGIGKTAAITYASYGATVILLGKTVPKLEATYDEIVKAGYPEPAIYPMDLLGANPDHHQEMAQTIIDNYGKLDGLLHNAGILGTLSPIANQNIEEWYRVQQVNINAPFLMTQACLPALMKAPSASIIFTSSGVGRIGRAYWGAYSVSKFATEALSQILADELETNTRVRSNCINPGATRTTMRAKAYPGEDPLTLKTPEDLMPLYVYLMSDDSVDISGQSLDAQ
jgi:NAD(P)-dependent dehydrogenase (short-subunit alcohol dehydrogenase family)